MQLKTVENKQFISYRMGARACMFLVLHELFLEKIQL